MMDTPQGKRPEAISHDLSVPRVCDVCGGSFLPKTYQSASCSDECRLQKKREAGKEYKRLKTAAKQASDAADRD